MPPGAAVPGEGERGGSRHGAEKAGSRGRHKDRLPEPQPELLGGWSHLSLQGPPPRHGAPGETIPALGAGRLGGHSGFSPLKSTPEPHVPCLRTMDSELETKGG